MHADYIPPAQEIHASTTPKATCCRSRLHDGSRMLLRKLAKDYDPTHRGKAFEYLRTRLREGEHVTGLIFVAQSRPDMHEMSGDDGRAAERSALREDCTRVRRASRTS